MAGSSPREPFSGHIKGNKYPPTLKNMTMPWFTIDLDLAPEQRFLEVTKPLGKEILVMIDQVCLSIGGRRTLGVWKT